MIAWEGDEELIQRILKSGEHAYTLMGAALQNEGEVIMTASKRDTPVDTGRLRASGHVQPYKRSGETVEVVLAYGTDYAVYVHEITSNAHPVGRSKFLEANVNAAAAGIEAALAKRLAKMLS